MKNVRMWVIAAVLSLPVAARCLTCVTQASGNWSSPAVWSACGGGVPGAGDTATISNPVGGPHVVVVDSGGATALSVTVRGTLSFSRVASSTLTLTAGDITVKSGGLLDMGTAASPISPASIRAALILAKGSGATRYGLIVEDGGTFTSFGAAKSPAGDALTDAAAPGSNSVQVSSADALGWAAGDQVVLGATEDGSFSELKTLASVTGSGPKTLSWTGGVTYDHVTGNGFRVSNLTRNVVVRSSGTDVDNTGDSAYLRNESTSAAGFSAALTEFAYLGYFGFRALGLVFDYGANGTISSCTVRNGFDGLVLFDPDGSTVTRSVFFDNEIKGISVESGVGVEVSSNDVTGLTGLQGSLYFSIDDVPSGNRILSNRAYSVEGVHAIYGSGAGGDLFVRNDVHNATYGLKVDGGTGLIVENNLFRRNDVNGMEFNGGNGHLIAGNVATSNDGAGLYLNAATACLLGGNQLNANTLEGVRADSAGSLFAGDVVYSNGASGFRVDGGAGLQLGDVKLGYTAAGTAAADTGAEITLNTAGAAAKTVTLTNARVNPAPGIATTGFNKAGNYLASYSPSGAPGTLQVNGDFAPASALTLDRAQRLMASRATASVLLRGSGHSLTGITSNDANAVSQVVSVRYDGAAWRVEGSSSGFMGTYTVGGGAQSFPAVNSQVTFTFTPGFATTVEDRVAFGLLAATNDANTRKWLLFGNGAAGFNGGKSRLSLASGVALSLSGTAAEPTVVDRLNGGSTYYTLIASGPVTMTNVTAQNMDASGFQLSGTGGVTMSSVTFDNIGAAGGAYLTLRSLTSSLILPGMVFNDSAARTPLSLNVQGTDSGLGWVMTGYSGARSGNASDFDPNGRIYWSGSTPVGTPVSFAAVGASDGISLSWAAPNSPPAVYRGPYRLYSSSVSASGPFVLLAAPLSTDTGYSHPSLSPQTTYYYRLQASDLAGVYGSSATAAAVTGDFALPAVSSLATSEGRTAGVGWTSALTITFNKSMPLASVQAGVGLRRLTDNLAVSTDAAAGVSVAAGGSADQFTVTPLSALAGNSLYELTVSTQVTDALGQPLASSATLRFTTLMDHAVRNIVLDGATGARVEVPALALARDGYVTAAAVAEGQVSAATQKLVQASGDALRRPVPGGVIGLDVFDDAGAPQSSPFGTPVTVSFPYSDTQRAGFVDGASPPAPVKALAVYWLNDERNLWVRLPSTVDSAAGTVSAPAPHFTTFALMIQSDADLSEAHPYPSPWTPLSGRSTVTFTGVGQGAVLRLYTMEGALVREMPAPDASGEMDWDLRNDGGAAVATGVYVYEISNGKSRKTGTIGVVR